ncbi:MAG: FtsW/RodA/SpoVE family cell cycle protein [Firmicutes bacterium]|nr:FtsW/RodA/SpoVE family cell cycle protein [Bacillota bacterium]
MGNGQEGLIEYITLYFTTGVRWVCMGLAVLILLHQIFALLRMRNPSEIWAYLKCPDASTVPLTHWENLMGRARGCDIILNLSGVSRSHGTLIRDSEGVWEYNDLNSKNGSYINGRKVTEPAVLRAGDTLTVGGGDFQLYPLSARERLENIEKRKRHTKRTSPWLSLLAITVFQLLTVIQFHISLGNEYPGQLTAAFILICVVMWAYVIALRMLKRTGFEVEIIAFFLSTLSLSLTASAYPYAVLKQAICVLLGVMLFFAMCWLLRDLNKAKRLIPIFLGLSVLLLIINLAFGTVAFGSQNWISIGGFTFQPSEIVKIVFIFVGAASLNELQQRRNLLIFMGFSAFCLICLAIMGDFGTAIIFFATFLVISFLRSGDFTKMFLVLGAAGLMGLMVLRFKPYVADRFSIWGHVWDDPTDAGFQQVQTMTSIASGGIPGLGAGEGNLSDVAAASTDLVFGMLAEEWGLVIAVLAVLCIITLSVFAYRSIIAGRSTYYCIAACAATSMFMFQTILNVFGSVDLLPLTGVTFPFVSSGGTSMIVSWGMLSFLKAADTRQNASLAVRVHEKDPEKVRASVESVSAVDIYDPEDLYELLGEEYRKPAKKEFKAQAKAEAKQMRKAEAKQAKAEAKQAKAAEPVPEPTRVSKPAPERRAEPERPAFSRKPQAPAATPGVRREEPAHPKAVRYTEVSDEDFFGKFDPPAKSAKPKNDEEGPLTLDDIFGEDGIFTDNRKGGKR